MPSWQISAGVNTLTFGWAAPSAEWSWISVGPEVQVEQWAAARWWFCSHDPHRKSCRDCLYELPSLQHTHLKSTYNVIIKHNNVMSIISNDLKVNIIFHDYVPFRTGWVNLKQIQTYSHLVEEFRLLSDSGWCRDGLKEEIALSDGRSLEHWLLQKSKTGYVCCERSMKTYCTYITHKLFIESHAIPII